MSDSRQTAKPMRPKEEDDMGGADGMDSLFSELAGAIPRIDEAMSFAEMLK